MTFLPKNTTPNIIIGDIPITHIVNNQPLMKPIIKPPNIVPNDIKNICNLLDIISSNASVCVTNSVLNVSIFFLSYQVQFYEINLLKYSFFKIFT